MKNPRMIRSHPENIVDILVGGFNPSEKY